MRKECQVEQVFYAIKQVYYDYLAQLLIDLFTLLICKAK